MCKWSNYKIRPNDQMRRSAIQMQNDAFHSQWWTSNTTCPIIINCKPVKYIKNKDRLKHYHHQVQLVFIYISQKQPEQTHITDTDTDIDTQMKKQLQCSGIWEPFWLDDNYVRMSVSNATCVYLSEFRRQAVWLALDWCHFRRECLYNGVLLIPGHQVDVPKIRQQHWDIYLGF